MQEFIKNILSYYAAFTETRFSNKSTLSYRWTNDINLTLDISFFPAFRSLWLEKLTNNDMGPIEIRSLQYKIEISSHKFKQKLEELLSSLYNLDLLKEVLSKKKDQSKVIGIAKENNISKNPGMTKLFLLNVRRIWKGYVFST